MVLPDPDSPTSACVVPAGTENDTSSTATSASSPRPKVFVSPTTSIRAGVASTP
ncbi:hypothetical protein [Nocardioides zeae]